MEERYQHSVNGAAAYSADINLYADEAALADDRVFAELCRMLPYQGAASRAVAPYRVNGTRTGEGATYPGQCIVQPGTGVVTVKPFRAFIGPRSAVALGTEKTAWRDIRSAICVGAAASLDTTVQIDATGGGIKRFDLVYAKVWIDEAARRSRGKSSRQPRHR